MPAIPRQRANLREASLTQTSMVTAPPMVFSLARPRGDSFFLYFWAGEMDLSLQEWIIQFRRPDSPLEISTGTANSTSSLSLTATQSPGAFFWGMGMGPYNLLSH